MSALLLVESEVTSCTNKGTKHLDEKNDNSFLTNIQ